MELTRRSLFGLAAAGPLASSLLAAKKIPVGLEMFSVRNELRKDENATIQAVAKMGYQVLEFFSPYFSWSVDRTKEVRKMLDDLGAKCLSTHNDGRNFTPENLKKAAELNQILGARYIVMASAGRVNDIDGWKRVAETLTKAADAWKDSGLKPGYHNHQLEFKKINGQRPMDILAADTPKDVMLQFDVGTCVEVGEDPVAWINANPGRIRSMHCKDWAPGADKGYRVLFGEGAVPWKKVFEAAEKKGGIEYYLIEQEGSAFPEFETAEKCLANFRKLRA